MGLGSFAGTLGPRSFGFVNVHGQVAPLDAPLPSLPRAGGLGLVVPARDALPDVAPLALARGLGLSWIVSVGDGDPAEALAFLTADAMTSALGIVLGPGATGASLRAVLGAKPAVVWGGDALAPRGGAARRRRRRRRRAVVVPRARAAVRRRRRAGRRRRGDRRRRRARLRRRRGARRGARRPRRRRRRARARRARRRHRRRGGRAQARGAGGGHGAGRAVADVGRRRMRSSCRPICAIPSICARCWWRWRRPSSRARAARTRPRVDKELAARVRGEIEGALVGSRRQAPAQGLRRARDAAGADQHADGRGQAGQADRRALHRRRRCATSASPTRMADVKRSPRCCFRASRARRRR